MFLVALMSRHQSEVATWGRLPGAVHCFVHCSGHCSGHCLDTVSWTLFMNTVHNKKKKKEYRNFKNFLVCDLIYGIFIVCLL